MARLFSKVRGLIESTGQTHAEFVSDLCREYPDAALSVTTFSLRLNCKKPWTLPEMYAILDYFNVPHREMHLYFPPDGLNAIEVMRMRGKRVS
jgi:hypothetical protein